MTTNSFEERHDAALRLARGFLQWDCLERDKVVIRNGGIDTFMHEVFMQTKDTSVLVVVGDAVLSHEDDEMKMIQKVSDMIKDYPDGTAIPYAVLQHRFDRTDTLGTAVSTNVAASFGTA